jgi:hypothetical protein
VGITIELVVGSAVVGGLEHAIAGDTAETIFVECLRQGGLDQPPNQPYLQNTSRRKSTLSLAPTNSMGYTILLQTWHFCWVFCMLVDEKDRADAGACLISAFRRRLISIPAGPKINHPKGATNV